MDRKIDKAMVLVAVLIAFATYNIAHGLRTGEIYGKSSWIALADDPERFWNNVVGNAATAAILAAWLWVVYSRSRR